MSKEIGLVCCLFTIMLAYACGGGGIDDISSAGGGTGGTGISVGPATSFGSIEVNETHFSTESAEIIVEGQHKGIGTQVLMNNIAIGMIVRVSGDIVDSQDGNAQQVYFNDDIRGPVDSIRMIDSLNTELMVLGQDILLTDTTRMDDTIDVESMQLGTWVSISGFNNDTGRLIASYIATTSSDDGANIKGIVNQLNTTGKHFSLSGIRIDYQDATIFGLMQLSEGLHVEVTGMLSDDHLSIKADRIEKVDLFGVTDSDNVKITGVVREVPLDTQLLLDGVSVTLNEQTDAIGGELQELDSGLRVEAEGSLVAGVLKAEKIIFLDNVKLESDVLTNLVNQSRLELAGLSDIPILYNEITKVTGAVDTAEDITDAHHVKILGRQTSQHSILAVHIIVINRLDNTAKLQGQLETPSERFITILGHTVDLSTIVDQNFESPEGVTVGYSEFLDSIFPGDLITLKGERMGTEIIWQSVSTE